MLNFSFYVVKNYFTYIQYISGLDILCKIPFEDEITQCCDSGKPVVLNAPESVSAAAYKKLALDVSSFLKKQTVNLN